MLLPRGLRAFGAFVVDGFAFGSLRGVFFYPPRVPQVSRGEHMSSALTVSCTRSLLDVDQPSLRQPVVKFASVARLGE